MSSPIEDVASLRQKLTDVELENLDLQKEVDGLLTTGTRLRQTNDELKEKNSILQTQSKAADPTVQEASRKEQEDKIHALEAQLEQKDQLMHKRDETWNVLFEKHRKEAAADPRNGRFSKLQAKLEASEQQNRIQEAHCSELEGQVAKAQASNKLYVSTNSDLESELDALRAKTRKVMEKYNKVVDEESNFISEAQDAFSRWVAYQSDRDLERIVDELLTSDIPQDSDRPASESRPTSQPQDLGIDTESPTQKPGSVPEADVEEVPTKIAQVDLEDQPSGSIAAPQPVGPGMPSIRRKSPPLFSGSEPVAGFDKQSVRVKLPVAENMPPPSRETSGRQIRSPTTSSTSGGIDLPVSGNFTGQTTARKGDNSPERLGRGQVPPVDPIPSSLRPPQLPPKDTVKPPDQALSNKVDVVKSANPSYSSKLQGPKQAAPPPYAASMRNVSELNLYTQECIKMRKKLQEENKEGDWGHISDSDSEPAKTSPPASNAAPVTDQSSTTEDHGRKPAPASNVALVTDELSTPHVRDCKRRRLN